MPSIFTRRQRRFFQGPDGPQYEKFSTKNKPTKRMFQWLFQAIGFLAESDDTAQKDVQGFVQLSTDEQARDKNSAKDSNGFSKVVQAHHLTHIISDSNTDNPDGNGSENNALSVRSYYGSYGRNGGDGRTYVIKNTMVIDTSEALDFITVSQEKPGENISLGFDEGLFNSKVSETDTIQTIEEDISKTQENVATGYPGEIKMYSFFNESLGDPNCEFNSGGIGRALGVEGASGKWAGWIILNGQPKGYLLTYQASLSLINRLLVDGDYIVTTAEKYPTGIKTTATATKGFQEIGSNLHFLVPEECGVRPHQHDLGGTAKVEITGGGAHKHSIRASENGQFADSRGGVLYDTNLDKDLLHEAWTGYTNTSPGVDQGAHTHPKEFSRFSGKTEIANGIPATSGHNNRPLSFVTMFAMYVGTIGSEI